MIENLERFKIPIALSLLGVVLIIGGVMAGNHNKGEVSGVKNFPKESLVDNTAKTIQVDVSGAVNTPGVYKLPDGSRMEEAIKLAGGFTSNVNQEYISKYLNLAQKLSDGTKIYVPFKGESISGPVSGSSSQAASGTSSSAKVNINTATQSEIEALPGIGPVTASKIISDRPYQTIEELQTQKIVSKAIFEKIKDQLVTY